MAPVPVLARLVSLEKSAILARTPDSLSSAALPLVLPLFSPRSSWRSRLAVELAEDFLLRKSSWLSAREEQREGST